MGAFTKEDYMRRAIELAKRGTGWVSPNPLVGAVIVKDGRIIGEGWHAKYGELHAERNALKNCIENTEGAEMYVTLEPCCHHGKQPPCTEAIIEAKISRVYVGSNDPNPLVAGKGIGILREHGIEVETRVLKQECDELNPVFFHYIRSKTPYTVMKYAMTMDGKIATYTGESKWITGEKARQNVHEDRHRYRGIMVGIGTVLADDPLLTCRVEGGRDPIRIICDSKLRMPKDSQIVMTARDIPTILATCNSDQETHKIYENAGCEILQVDSKDGHVNLRELMMKLGTKNIDSVLLEGGGTLNWEMLNEGLVQKVQAYIAPKIFGGESAKSPVQGAGVEKPDKAFILSNSQITRLGDDTLIESEVMPNVHRDS